MRHKNQSLDQSFNSRDSSLSSKHMNSASPSSRRPVTQTLDFHFRLPHFTWRHPI
jgi:hypothetical protein